MDIETTLPAVLATAAVSGDGHHAWRRDALADVVGICRQAGVAILGVEVWGIAGREILAAIPVRDGGTRAFGWSAPERPPGCSWSAYVEQCGDGVLAFLAANAPEQEVADAYGDRLFYHLVFTEMPAGENQQRNSDHGDGAAPVQQALMNMFNSAPIKHALGMSIRFASSGEAVFTLPPDERFFHGMGDVHGGMVTTLMDNAGWFTAAAHYNRLVLTADLNIRLLEAARRQEITATGTMIRAGRTMAVVEMTASTTDGRLIAKGSGTFTVTRSPVIREK